MFSIRRLLFSLLLLLVFAVIVPFVLPLKEGKPLLSLSQLNLSLPDVPAIPKVNPSEWLPDNGEAKQVTVYRWQDNDGTWQYGEKPPEGVAFEAVTLDTDANLIQALPTAPANAANDAPSGTVSGVISGYSNAMEKARGVEQTLQQGHEQRMRAVDGN